MKQEINTAICWRCTGSTFDRFGRCCATLILTDAGEVTVLCRKCNSDRIVEAILGVEKATPLQRVLKDGEDGKGRVLQVSVFPQGKREGSGGQQKVRRFMGE